MALYKGVEVSERHKQLIDEWVDNIICQKMGEKTTIAFVKLSNGFEIIGYSACVHPENYTQALGEQYAIKDALDKLGEHIAFTQHIPILAQFEQLGTVTEIDTDDMAQFIQDKMREEYAIVVTQNVINRVIEFETEYMMEVKGEVENG